MMYDSKKFDIDSSSDYIIIDDVWYADTPGLYKLIFIKNFRYDMYTKDKRKYKSMLATNAQMQLHRAQLFTEQQRVQV